MAHDPLDDLPVPIPPGQYRVLGGLLLDGSGFIWAFDWQGASVSPLNSAVTDLLRYYTSTDCTGPAYVAEPDELRFRFPPLEEPRWVISVVGVTGFFAAGDQQQRESVVVRSRLRAGCEGPFSAQIEAMRFDQMRSVPSLTINPVGPAHIERR